MSNLTEQIEQACEVQESHGVIERVLKPKTKDLGGFSVRRVLPTIHQKKVGPWVFLDHMGPVTFPEGKGVDVRPHPHIGLATVTYLFEGEVLHRDSLGNALWVRPGEINLMVAGRGIVHSERKRPESDTTSNRLHGLQMWLALPESMEDIDPAFYHYAEKDIPLVNINGVAVRLLIGAAYGATSPVKMFADTLYLEATLMQGQHLEIPDAEERAIYIVSGELKVDAAVVPEYTMLVLNAEQKIVVSAVQETRIAVIGGEKINPRYIDWNFVSSQKEKIELAKQKWKAGLFERVPGDENEFIPLPE
ncbi:MAG TPA: pirin family protein [Cellvibrio sp.]|nr:pirin family protein [Cellvibrio sp.]